MFSFVQNWFSPKANPIGIDFGSDSLRLAQIRFDGQDHKLFAAASSDVPSHAQCDPESRFDFFTESVRDLLSQGKFHGRQVVLSLPAHMMYIQHLRMPKMDDASLKKAVRWEAKGKLPIDTSNALMRHLVAGEVHQDNEQKLEVIVMAAPREMINRYLAVASKAKLDVIGMNIEPMALVDCFSHVYRRKADADMVNLFVDIGSSGTRATIAQGGSVLFARTIPHGGNELTQAVAKSLQVSADDARLLRLKAASAEPAPADGRDQRNVSPATDAPAESSFAFLGAAMAQQQAVADPEITESRRVEQACGDVITRLVDELTLCRRYHESTFPGKPVQRLIFVGGEARHRWLCQRVAREVGLAAQVGDPLVRMARISDISIDSGIDRRLPQPAWAVAIGLSFGSPRPVDETSNDEITRQVVAGVSK